MAQPADAPVPGSPEDPLTEALGLARSAAAAGLGMKLLGGLAVRVLCPDYPPRLRRDQDMDFATTAKGRKDVAAWLADNGCEPDRRFNNLNGDRQMYFNAPSGRPIDVMVNQLTMCHTLDFRPNFDRQPFTVDSVDVLLSKLQIIELNEKDARDIVQLLSCLPVGTGTQAAIDTDRFGKVLGRGLGLVAHRHREPGQTARAAGRDPGASLPRRGIRPAGPGPSVARDRRCGPEEHEVEDAGQGRRRSPLV